MGAVGAGDRLWHPADAPRSASTRSTSSPTRSRSPPAEIARIKQECQAQGLPIISVACVALGLVDFNPSVRRFHVDRVKAYLDMARGFEARNVLLVLGEYLWQKEVIPPPEQWGFGVETVQKLGEHAAELGLEIALELEPFHLSILNDVASMGRFLDDVGHPSVLANLDISHLVLAHQSPDLIDQLRGKVAHVHISDCDGVVHGDPPAPVAGVIDFAPYMRAIRDLAIPDATISIELEYSPEPDRIVEWVTEAYESTATLMRDAGSPSMTAFDRLGAIVGPLVVALGLILVVGWPTLALVEQATGIGQRDEGGDGRDPIVAPRPGEIARPWGTGAGVDPLDRLDRGNRLAAGAGAGVRPVSDRRPGGDGGCCSGRSGWAAFVPTPLLATGWLGGFGNAGRDAGARVGADAGGVAGGGVHPRDGRLALGGGDRRDRLSRGGAPTLKRWRGSTWRRAGG